MSLNAATQGSHAIARHRAVIDAAKAAGTGRIADTSHMGASASSDFVPMHTHAATEATPNGSGLAWTTLWNGFYASTLPMMIGDAAAHGLLAVPKEAPVSIYGIKA